MRCQLAVDAYTKPFTQLRTTHFEHPESRNSRAC
jgi:hypothetical protein